MPATYCFARSTHRYLDLDAGRDFEREIIVKVNVPEVVRAELGRRSWKRELVAIGTNTDPYQWVESRYRLMPPVLEALHEAETPISVLTKSPLVLRDVERYVEMASAAGATVNLSIPTLDEKVWRQTEPHTPHPRARMEAVAELNRRGIDSGVLVMPLMPGINDDPAQVDPLVELAREAKASFVATHRAAPSRRGPRCLLRLAAGEASRPSAPLREPLRPRRLPPPKRTEPTRRPRKGVGEQPQTFLWGWRGGSDCERADRGARSQARPP